MPLAGPFHRAPDAACGPWHEREFRVNHAARAEIAAHVVHQHPHPGFIDIEYQREVFFHPHRAAAARMQRVALRCRVVFAHSGARLHRHTGDTLYPGVDFCDMRGAGERSRRGFFRAHVRIHAHIRFRFVPQTRRVRLGGGACCRYGGQHLVIDLNQFSAILGNIDRLRNHHRNDFADIAHFLNGHRITRRYKRPRAVGVDQLHFGRMQREYIVRNVLDVVGAQVRAGEHCNHTGQRQRFAAVDAAYVCMRVRRTQHDRVHLPRQIHVIAEAAFAGDEA